MKSKNVITVDIGMQVNIGKVMNLAHKAGYAAGRKGVSVDGSRNVRGDAAEVATAYTMFANLGDRVDPLPITQVTTGDGRIVASPHSEKNVVLRPDVAYIMDDMLKDVINRGTAAEPGLGFQECAGQDRFCGQDRNFAETVGSRVLRRSSSCVVYVGFDDGSRPRNERLRFGDADLGRFYEGRAKGKSRLERRLGNARGHSKGRDRYPQRSPRP